MSRQRAFWTLVACTAAIFLGQRLLVELLKLIIPFILVGIRFSIGSEAFNEDAFFLIDQLLNPIVVFTPAMIFYALGFKLIKRDISHEPYWYDEFKWRTIPAYFPACYTLAVVASYINVFLVIIFADMFMKDIDKLLPDPFEHLLPSTAFQWAMMFLFIGIIGPILEELVYRKYLLNPLRRFGDKWAILVTSLLFGILHGNLTQFLYAAVAGVLLGILTVRAGSVIPAIIVHALNNLYNVLLMYFRSLVPTIDEHGEAISSELIKAHPITASVDRFTVLFLLTGVICIVCLAWKGHLRVSDEYNT